MKRSAPVLETRTEPSSGRWLRRSHVGIALVLLGAIVTGFAAAMPAGPSAAPTLPSSVRVVARTVSTRTDPSSGVVPPDGVVTIYGYDHVSIVEGSSGLVKVPLDAAKSRALLMVLNRLPHVRSGQCMENAVVYKLSVRVPGQQTATDVVGWACDATVGVTVGSSPRPTLNDVSCALLHTVVSDLPPNEADGTRHAAVGCREGAAQ